MKEKEPRKGFRDKRLRMLLSIAVASLLISGLVAAMDQLHSASGQDFGGDEPLENEPPVAIAYPEFQEVKIFERAWFNGSLSYDPDGFIVNYTWDFDDGSFGFGVCVEHFYLFPGNYSVELTVTDDGGLSDTDWVVVIVRGDVTNPFILFTVPMDGERGVKLYEEITISFSEPMNTQTVVWTIDPDPGCWNESWWIDDTMLILSHCNPFEENTPYAVHVAYGESKKGYPLISGPVPNPWSFLTTGGNIPPVAIAFPDVQCVFVGEPAWFDGSMSYDPDGFIVYYLWDFGDGSFGEGPFTEHAYALPGNYSVALTVYDNDNLSSSDMCVVFVEGGPQLPDLSLTGEDTTISKETPAEGEVVWIHAHVHNIGSGAAFDILVRFIDCYADCSVVIGETHIGYLSPGSSEKASIQWTAGPMGNHTLIVVIDPENDIEETDETNNLACKHVFVEEGPPYEIIVEAYTFDNDGDGIFDDVVIVVHDSRGNAVEGAHVHIDGDYFANTPDSGVLSTYNFPNGSHRVQVHFGNFHAETLFIVS